MNRKARAIQRLPAAGWRKKGRAGTLLTQHPGHYLPKAALPQADQELLHRSCVPGGADLKPHHVLSPLRSTPTSLIT
jgi:hypothetical protein